MNKIKKVSKIWGEEIWIQNQKDYCGKLLKLKRGFRCSLHYHKKKDETFYLIRGKVLMEVERKKWIMKPKDSVHIKPRVLHRFTGLTDAQIVEFSSHHEDSDSYRKEQSGKVQLRRAYDYDGVITAGIKPEKDAPIITGRSFEEIKRVNRKIREKHPVYFNAITINEKTLEKEIRWKAEMIKKLKIEEFYENDSRIVTKLEKLCPNCHIVNVGEIKVQKSK